MCKSLKEVLDAEFKIADEPALKRNNGVKELIDRTANATKEKFLNKIKNVKNKVINTVKNAKSKAQEYKKNVKDGIDEVDTATQSEEMATTLAASANSKKTSRWTRTKKEEGRSEIVADGVQSIKEARNNTRARMGRAALKVVGFVGKGAVLFGPKGKELANKMVTETGRKTENFVSRESRIGKVLEHVADAGYTTAEGVRAAKDKVIEVGGKAIGTIAGVGLATVEIGKAVGRKGKTKIIDPVKDAGKDVAQKAEDTKNFGSKALDLAKKRFEKTKNIIPGLKQRTAIFLKNLLDRVTPSLAEKEAVNERNQAYAQSKDEASKAFNKLTGRENSDGDER